MLDKNVFTVTNDKVVHPGFFWHSNICFKLYTRKYQIDTLNMYWEHNDFHIMNNWNGQSVKLSTHEFTVLICLYCQYPVISVDNYLPIVDPLSGSQFGQMKVLLAMGSGEQITALQRLKLDGPSQAVTERPQHYLERYCIHLKMAKTFVLRVRWLFLGTNTLFIFFMSVALIKLQPCLYLG